MLFVVRVRNLRRIHSHKDSRQQIWENPSRVEYKSTHYINGGECIDSQEIVGKNLMAVPAQCNCRVLTDRAWLEYVPVICAAFLS